MCTNVEGLQPIHQGEQAALQDPVSEALRMRYTLFVYMLWSLMMWQDDPRRRRPADPEPEWAGALQRVVRCQKILDSANNDLKVCFLFRSTGNVAKH